MLESLLRHNKDCRFVIHTFRQGLSEQTIEKMRSFLQEKGAVLQIHELPRECIMAMESAPTLSYISTVAYYRLFSAVCDRRRGQLITVP